MVQEQLRHSRLGRLVPAHAGRVVTDGRVGRLGLGAACEGWDVHDCAVYLHEITLACNLPIPRLCLYPLDGMALRLFWHFNIRPQHRALDDLMFPGSCACVYTS